MELNKAAEKTFTVAVSGHVGFGSAELRAVRAHAAMLPSFPPQITLAGDAGLAYTLQGSTNLFNWVPVFTGTAAPNGTFKFTTTNAAIFNYRFFRSVRLP